MNIQLLAVTIGASIGLSVQAADNVKIGFISTLSGPTATIGVDIRDGFNLALKLAGGKLGGLTAEVLVADDQFKPELAKQHAERLVKLNNVDLVTGVVFSNIVVAAAPTVLESDTIFIAANAAPSNFAGTQCNHNFFVASWPSEAFSEAAGQFASTKNFRNIILLAPNYQGGRDVLEGFKRQYKGDISQELYTKLGQLDYGAELAQIRAAKPDAMYVFLPGGMGINFLKQFVAAGMSQEVQLIVPSWSVDQDVIGAVGEATLGLFNTSHWALDFANAANIKFVSEFQKEYSRLPTGYAAQGYDTALLIDSAIRNAKGKVKDREALRKAMRAARFDSVRGEFSFNSNQYPVQNYYLHVVGRDAAGRIANKTIATVLTKHGDVHAQHCRMQ